MADLREKVVEDRGILSKIQMFVPGFRGYRIKEDLRAADNMLRLQLAQGLASIRKEAEGCRSDMADNNSLEHMERLGVLINRFKTVEQEVGHAAQGFSGISAKVKVGEAELNKLYEYDYALVSRLTDMGGDVRKLKAAAGSDDKAAIKENIAALAARIDAFEATFKNRMAAITGMEA
jgi:hypothetical protein